MRNNAEWATVEKDVTEVVRHLYSLLPKGIADLEIAHTYGTSLALKPTNPKSAVVGVTVSNGVDVVYVDFGPAQTTWELPWESSNPRDRSKDFLLHEVKQMFAAVICGSCEEEYKWLRVTGRIKTAKHTYSVTTTPKKGTFRGKKSYEAYHPEVLAIFAQMFA